MVETAKERCRRFREMHESGCFLIPNPWDIGSAKFLQHLGFKALATTSAGFAFSRGLADGTVPRDPMLAHIAEIVNATSLPVNADFGGAFADAPEAVAQNVKLCAQMGVAGLSVEDSTGDVNRPLYDFQLSVERVKAAKAALLASHPEVMLVARAEVFLVGHADPLNESIRRLEAYADAGADVLFAPGLRNADDIKAVIASAGAKPVNVLAGPSLGMRLEDIAALGVRRVSVGGGLARAAWGGFIRAAMSIAREGSFEGLEAAAPASQLNQFFSTL